MKEIKLPIQLLNAAYIASSKYDWFRGIDSVLIDQGNIVGTDGAVLFYAKVDVPEDFKINIPRVHVQSFLKKLKNFTSIHSFLLQYGDDGYIKMFIPNCHGCIEVFQRPIVQNYPNWKNVIQIAESAEHTDYSTHPQFASKKIKKLEKIAHGLGGICQPIIHSNSDGRSAAKVIFKFSEYENVNALIMPLDNTFSIGKYCVEMVNEPDSEPTQTPAASAEIAFRAVERTRKEFDFGLGSQSDGLGSYALFIKAAVWRGSDTEHAEKMFYTEDWFNKPFRKFDNIAKATQYIKEMNDVVEFHVGEKTIVTKNLDELQQFYKDHVEA
ncbi:hypothetical protein ACX1NX_11520 [Acinetobacter sp. ANC 5383]